MTDAAASSILVAGLINYEVTLQVDSFPIAYTPARYPFFGVRGGVSGVGYNVARALTTLGSPARLLALVGDDSPGQLARQALAEAGIPEGDALPALAETPQSVILYDGAGRRQVNTDLKDLQERAYPPERAAAALAGCRLAALCNVNWARALLAPARAAGCRIATDVHAIADLDDPYNADFMAAADILFLSHERLPDAPEVWVRAAQARYDPAVLVIGLGAEGALLAPRGGPIERLPAVITRPVVNTVGAGDALFAAFLHFHARGLTPRPALQRALIFAGHKIGESGGARGFLDEAAVEALARERSGC